MAFAVDKLWQTVKPRMVKVLTPPLCFLHKDEVADRIFAEFEAFEWLERLVQRQRKDSQ